MDILIDRDLLYQSLKINVSIISNRPRLLILTHVLLEINRNYLSIISTNLEVEILSRILLDSEYTLQLITIPGRKFFDICRNLPKCSIVLIALQNNKMFIRSGSSSFTLSTMPVSNFPQIKIWKGESHVVISQSVFKKMIELTQFAMAYQDARYYLNGMFFETNNDTIRMVASDGYRLAMTEMKVDLLLPSRSMIIPRKGIIEFLNLLHVDQNEINIQIYDNRCCIKVGNYVCNSKLIDAKFPNYFQVFPEKPKIIFEVERIMLQQALKRVSILSNSKLRVVSLCLTKNQLKITTSNFDQERAEETLKIVYSKENINISFNVDYLLDVVNVIDSRYVKIFLTNMTSSMQIEGIPKCCGATYIIMPIRV